MQADLTEDGSELIVCMTARIDDDMFGDTFKSRFLDIFKIPIKAEAAEKVYHRKNMEVVRMRKAEDDKMIAEEEESRRLALKKK